MADADNNAHIPSAWPTTLRQLRARTPARLLEGRAGAGYRTETQLCLREAHAAARDAVRVEFDPAAVFGGAFLEQLGMFETTTRARTKDEYLLNPDLGRHFSDASRAEIVRRCGTQADVQVAIGDGLSVQALAAQIPALLPLLHESIVRRGWSFGQVFVIRHCRVGILNEIGELLSPAVAVLLIGERPGLAAADSLSAYMAYCPSAAHTDANRNLISNIHARGLSPKRASQQIVDLAARMIAERISGWQLKTGDRNPALPTSDTERG
jgi:ethanolamine ammonia-lyase small subunit